MQTFLAAVFKARCNKIYVISITGKMAILITK